MPTDKNGVELAIGDKVNVPCVVTGFRPGGTFKEIQVDTADDRGDRMYLGYSQVVAAPDAPPVPAEPVSHVNPPEPPSVEELAGPSPAEAVADPVDVAAEVPAATPEPVEG